MPQGKIGGHDFLADAAARVAKLACVECFYGKACLLRYTDSGTTRFGMSQPASDNSDNTQWGMPQSACHNPLRNKSLIYHRTHINRRVGL